MILLVTCCGIRIVWNKRSARREAIVREFRLAHEAKASSDEGIAQTRIDWTDLHKDRYSELGQG